MAKSSKGIEIVKKMYDKRSNQIKMLGGKNAGRKLDVKERCDE